MATQSVVRNLFARKVIDRVENSEPPESLREFGDGAIVEPAFK